jgi:hypothetical protein
VPKGSALSIPNPDSGEMPKARELCLHEPVDERAGVSSSVIKEPTFPRQRQQIKQHVDELHKQAMVLIGEVFDVEAPTFFANAQPFLFDQAL